MIEDLDLKRQVREFYDAVGWQLVDEGLYQNARYEDLRAVSREYIHRCHERVGRHVPAGGTYLLDAGSGPIQYPEYVDYSRGYRRRICLDISAQALREARRRIGEHGAFVVGDVANLPFKPASFDGVVSLHTIHHLPASEQLQAFEELCRAIRPGGRVVVVYSWGDRSPLMRLMRGPIAMAERLQGALRHRRDGAEPSVVATGEVPIQPTGTYTFTHDYRWVRANLAGLPGFDLVVWRSVSTAFLRAFILRPLLGQAWLRLLYFLEELAPRGFGRIGQYPMILFSKTG
jgi:SAM-dependent methyltransferase